MLIGNGQFLLGDALALMRSMPNDSVDCILTDPPYKTISGGIEHSKRLGRFQMFSNETKSQDGSIFKHNDCKISDYLPEFFRILKSGSHCYVMTNNINLRELLNQADRVGFGFHNLLIWEKNNANPNRWYMKNMELTVFLYKKPAKTVNNPNSKQIIKFDNIRNKLHPTQKPIELMQYYIENSTQLDELVFDPFAGSGSTAIAAELLGRRWLCCELDLQYYLTATGRMWSHQNASL